MTDSLWPIPRPTALHTSPWLGQRGLIVAACLFVLGAFIAWYAWVHRARPLVYHVPPYQPPLATIILAAGAILLLAFAASRIRISHSSAQSGDAPSAWIVGSAAFVLALPWFYLIRLAYGAMPALPVFIPISVGLIWAGIAWLLIARWSSDRGWSDMHRLALIFGAIVASMLAGFGTGRWLAVDLYAKIILNVLAVLLLFYLALRVHRTPAS